MLNYHDTCDLEGKIAPTILSQYRTDYRNLTLASIIAGYHRACGLKNEGIAISMEIINTIDDDTEDIRERNILLWNLYVLSGEIIDDNLYDDALKILDRAEKNWSRDAILGDEIGVYHVSWIEQIWLKKAEIYFLINDKGRFESITDRILESRFKHFYYAGGKTGETIIYDRCAYSCLELMALEKRKRNIKTAIGMIKKAVLYKEGYDAYNGLNYKVAREYEVRGILYKAFQIYCKEFYRLPDHQYDITSYGYCKSCEYYNGGNCSRHNILVGENKACTQYR